MYYVVRPVVLIVVYGVLLIYRVHTSVKLSLSKVMDRFGNSRCELDCLWDVCSARSWGHLCVSDRVSGEYFVDTCGERCCWVSTGVVCLVHGWLWFIR